MWAYNEIFESENLDKKGSELAGLENEEERVEREESVQLQEARLTKI